MKSEVQARCGMKGRLWRTLAAWGKGAALLAACILAGLLAMTAVYAIPAEAVRENVKASVRILEQEGVRHEAIPGYKGSRLDTFTDAIMLGNAVVMPEETAFKNALLTHRLLTSEAIDALGQYLEDESAVGTVPYSIYWHGYLTVLKPLLCVMSLGSIRFLLMAVQMLLLAAVAALLGRRGMARFVLPLAAMAVSLCPPAVMSCLTYSSVYLVGMGAAALILLAHERLERIGYGYVFLLVGVLTSFFDFLTYPIFTLGIPLAVLALATMQTGGHVRPVRLAALCMAWGAGYGGMWAGKWLLVSALTEVDGLGEALFEVAYRTGSSLDDVGEVSATAGLESCMELLLNPLMVMVLAACVGACLLLLWCRGVRRGAAADALALALIALLPVAWLLFACNHSVSHAFFAYRSLSVLVFAALCAPLALAGNALRTRIAACQKAEDGLQ